MKILAIETSCDETSCAVVRDGVQIVSNVIASSKTLQQQWGGIVPEIAAREQLRYMIPTLIDALTPVMDPKIPGNEIFSVYRAITECIDAIAVTVGPGLIGSLILGIEAAKTIAYVTGKPVIPVNHVLAHMYANFLTGVPAQGAKGNNTPSGPASGIPEDFFPAISLVVSGGHTELFLMESAVKLIWLGGTLDDAAGEAFDKSARVLGLGAGGGPAIQESAAKHVNPGSPSPAPLPRPLYRDGSLNFSFSGLKTAIMRDWGKLSDPTAKHRNMFAWELQESITDVLVAKSLLAAKTHCARSVMISGGVASNIRLRDKLCQKAQENDIYTFFPPVSLCTDNAAYIASCAYFRNNPLPWNRISVQPDLSVEVKG